MRVLVTSTPGTGHLHPIVPLARELQDAGHEVVWATAAPSCAAVERYGFRPVPCGMDLATRAVLLAEHAGAVGRLPPRERRALLFSTVFASIAAPAMHADLTAVVDAVEPDLVVHDLAELAAAPVATARGVPHVSVGFSGALTDEVQAAALDAIAPLWEREGLSVSAAGFNGALLLHPFPATLDAPRPDGPSAPMRPMSFDGADPTAEPEWISGFGAQRPGVYVTFGTEMAPMAPWAPIIEALAGLDVDAIATIGGQLDPATLGPLPANVRVERYVPQSFLLDQALVVVSHGGAGTLIAAATTGRVQLSVPIGADQWENADLISAAGAGITLETGERDAEVIGRSIGHLLTNEAMHSRARVLAGQFAAMPHPRELVARLEQLV